MPHRNMAGVNGIRSFWSSVTVVNGRSLTTFSTWLRQVLNCSQSTHEFPSIHFNKSVIVLISLSHQPPHHAEEGGLKIHLICSIPAVFSISGQFSLLNKFTVPMKFVPLSLYTVFGRPRTLTNRHRALTNASVLRDITKSM